MVAEPMEGVLMATKPAIRITAGDVPAPVANVNVALFGGHMDGLAVTDVEVPGTWPLITTLERVQPKGQPKSEFAYIPRRYSICLCNGRVQLDRRRRVRYCLQEA